MDDEIKIQGIERISPQKTPVPPVSRRRKKQQKQQDAAGDHFQELARKAARAHRRLVEKNSPYRFCIHEKDGKVFIDVAIVDADNRIVDIHQRNITHDQFQTWLKLIETESGMIFDEKA